MITEKQEQEINFLSKYFGGFQPNKKEIEDFIQGVVYGKKELGIRNNNRLFQAKRRFEMTLKMWKEDLPRIITKEELLEDFNNNPYISKIINKL